MECALLFRSEKDGRMLRIEENSEVTVKIVKYTYLLKLLNVRYIGNY